MLAREKNIKRYMARKLRDDMSKTDDKKIDRRESLVLLLVSVVVLTMIILRG